MKDNGYINDITAIVDAVKISSDHSYKIYDKEFQVAYQMPYQQWHGPMEQFGKNTGDQAQMKQMLLSHLAGAIYSNFYTHGKIDKANLEVADALAKQGIPPQEERTAFMDKLSEVNATQNGYDSYWTVYSTDQMGNAFVNKNGEVKQLLPNTYQFANPADTQMRVGQMVHIMVQKENREMQPTFYHVHSQEMVNQQTGIVRFYFNVNKEGAPVLVKEITTKFNKYKIPFSFKCENHDSLFHRADSAVLYFDKMHFRLAGILLKSILPAVKPYLDKEIPLFTMRIADGVGFAEDPGSGQSFGMSRSVLIAQGIIQARDNKITGAKEKVREVLRHFDKNGVDPKKVYLKPNTSFPYDFSVLN